MATPQRVADLIVGGGSSYPTHLTVMGDALYFIAQYGTKGEELWRTNGTALGTTLVREIRTDTNGSFFSPGLYSTYDYASFAAIGNTLYFTANDGSTGFELWSTNGSAAGTVQRANLRPDPAGSKPRDLTAVQNTLFFVADDGTSGQQLWSFNGSTSQRLSGTLAGPGGAGPQNLTALGNRLFFTADDGVSGNELWTSDGTTAGTQRVADLRSGAYGSDPSGLTPLGSKLFFTANDGLSGFELWSHDTATGATAQVADIQLGAGDANPTELRALGSRLFFSADDGNTGFELWSHDTATGLTSRVADILTGAGSSSPSGLTAVGSRLFFSAEDGLNGFELWSHDTATGTTQLVRDISPGTYGSRPNQLTAVGNKLFFVADDGTSGSELWSSDGTTAGTVRVADLYPNVGYVRGSYPTQLTAVGTMLFFVATDPAGGSELWSLDTAPPAATTILAITAVSAAQAEGNSGTTSFSFTVSRSGPLGSPSSAAWAVSGGATNPADAADFGGTLPSGIVTFAANESSRTITVNVSGDTLGEANELFTVRLSQPSGAVLSTTAASATATITNDDLVDGAAPTVTGLKVAGTTLQVQFSEAVVTTGITGAVIAQRFSARVAGVARSVSAASAVAGDPTRLNLTLSGTAPTAGQAVQLVYNDATAANDATSVVQDAAGNDLATIAGLNAVTFSSGATVASLNLAYTHLVLTGTGAINGTANANANTITGNSGNNSLTGGAGDDTLSGLAGNDTLNGGVGIDRMEGGLGNDVYLVDAAGDQVLEAAAAGTDVVRSSVGFTLPGEVENLVLLGSIGLAASGNGLANRLTGTIGADTLNGGLGADTLSGGAGDDTYLIDDAADVISEAAASGIDTVSSSVSIASLAANLEHISLQGSAALSAAGNELANRIAGNTATNRLNGGGANDTLTGGSGGDTFRFDTAPNSTTNSDTITDFNRTEGDLIELENAVFTALSTTGALTPTTFFSGSAFSTDLQRILYNPGNGTLTYDSNGSSTAAATVAVFATLPTGLTLTSSAFVVT